MYINLFNFFLFGWRAGSVAKKRSFSKTKEYNGKLTGDFFCIVMDILHAKFQ